MEDINEMASAIRELSASIKESFFELGSSVESLSQSFQLMVTKMTVDAQMQQRRKIQEVPQMVEDTREVKNLLIEFQRKFGTDKVRQLLIDVTGCDRLPDIKPLQYTELRNALVKKLQER